MRRYRSKKLQRNLLLSYEQLLERWGVHTIDADIPTSYGSTHVHIFGRVDAPPLVLFHGVADDSALMWIYNAAGLAAHFRVYAVDTIGGPGKSIPNSSYNKGFDAALWIDQVLDGLELERVNLAGVSHGGYLAQYYTLTRTERVEKAIALASSVPVGTAKETMATMMKIFMPEALFPTKRNVRKLLVKLSGSNSAAFTDNPLVVQHFEQLLRGYNNMAMRHHNIISFSEEQIQHIKPKLLYLVGERDPFAIRGGKAQLELHQMNVIYFPNAGHGINHELPEQINTAIIDYLT
jgi:pimeloyl-ACP methyl ester carboxylesterase